MRFKTCRDSRRPSQSRSRRRSLRVDRNFFFFFRAATVLAATSDSISHHQAAGDCARHAALVSRDTDMNHARRDVSSVRTRNASPPSISSRWRSRQAPANTRVRLVSTSFLSLNHGENVVGSFHLNRPHQSLNDNKPSH